MKRIVLTGGPGAGKTWVTLALVRRSPERYVRATESATSVYDRLGTRWDQLSIEQRRGVQRDIYRQQIEQEERIAREHPGKTMLLDRGTVDGAAYWPDGPADYWRELGTTIERELARYDRVILLESCAALGESFYDGDSSNPRRHESAAAAIAAGKLLEKLWGAHSHVEHVNACETIEQKLAAVVRLLPRDKNLNV